MTARNEERGVRRAANLGRYSAAATRGLTQAGETTDAVTCGEVTRVLDSVATEDIPAQGITAQVSVQQSGALISTLRSSDALQHGVARGRLVVNRNINASATPERRFRLCDLGAFTFVILFTVSL